MKKIYIIEDDANILYGMQAKFGVEGFETKINNGSALAVEIVNEIRDYKPDLIILDLILPRVDGFEVAKMLQADESLNQTPIFAFTSLSDNDSKERGLKLGINYYLLKTELSVDDVVAKVIKILKNKEKLK